MLACNIINEMSWHCGKHIVATLNVLSAFEIYFPCRNNFHLIENYANPYDIMQSLWLAGRIADKSQLQLA